jgi:predicted XRE-type DNA-binding protein
MMIIDNHQSKKRRKNMRPNLDLINLIRNSGFSQWKTAEKMGVHENTLCRMLRKELNEQEKARIVQALEQLKKERIAELSVQILAN